MFAAPSSTTAIESLSSSPTSTTSPSQSDNNKIILSSKDGFDCEKGYTIYVPANVRFRGMNMHLDLKIDEKTLSAAASSEILRAKQQLPARETERSIEPSCAGLTKDARVKSPKAPSLSENTSISCSYISANDEESASKDGSKELQNVTSTTTEQVEHNFVDASAVDGEVSSHSDDVPVTSTISASQEDAEAVVDTTTTAPDDSVVGIATTSATFPNTSTPRSDSSTTSSARRRSAADVAGDRTKLRDDGVDAELADRCTTSSASLNPPTDCCQPSSSSEIKTDHYVESFPDDRADPPNRRSPKCGEFTEAASDELIHDSQPCSSSNLSNSEQISSTAPGDSGAVKKKRVSTPNFCGHVDNEKGQCKQRAILNYRYCIRHILLDPTSPYRQCQHRRKPKNKKGDSMQCTNAIRTDRPDIFCSTHLIMKGMMQPKAKRGGIAASTIDLQSMASPSTVMASPAAGSKTSVSDFLDESTTASARSMMAAEGNSSFETTGHTSFGGDPLSHSRTGCESTSSWDQMSNMSGSMTPSRTNFSQQQLPNGQPSDFAQCQYRDGVIIAKTPPLGHQPMIAQAAARQHYAHMNATPRSSAVADQSTPIETAVEAPNFDNINSENMTSRYFAQQTPQYAAVNEGRDSREAYINGSLAASAFTVFESQIQRQMQSPAPLSADLRRVADSENGSVATLPFNQASTSCNVQPQISCLSKQHPQLAAKLLQPPSYPPSQAAHIPIPYAGGCGDSSVMISPEKHNFLPQTNAQASTFAAPPPAKRTRPDVARIPPTLAFRNVVLAGGDAPDGVMAYPPQYMQQRLAQSGQVILPQRMASNEHLRQAIRSNAAIQQQQRMPAVSMRHPGGGLIMQQASRHPGQNYSVTPQISSQQLGKILPKPAYIQYQTRLMEAISAQCVDISSFVDAEPKASRYRINSSIEDLGNGVDEETKIKRDYMSNLNAFKSPSAVLRHTKRSISLRRKRRKVRITGAFRDVPLVNSMCKIIECHDFDSSDLFPLGLEPSDDESSSDDSFPLFNNDWLSESLSNLPMGSKARHRYNSIQLYLLKKKLRLESLRLVKGAKVSLPIVEAAKSYPNCVGAALRTREMNHRRETIIGVERRRHRACHKTSSNGQCQRPCLPMSNYCADHVLYGVEQKLFTYCKRVCCGRPVLCADTALFDGLCRMHYEESIATPSSKPAGGPNSDCVKREVPFAVGDHLNSQSVSMSNGNFNAMPAKQSSNCSTNFGANSCEDTSKYFNEHADQSNDDVVEDVSLASVAKDLGLNGRELTDMLERLPVDDSLDGHNIEDDDDEFFDSIKAEEDASGLALGHSWADVEQFLLSEGYHGTENAHSKPPVAGNTGGSYVENRF